MSAGQFTTSRYAASYINTLIHPIRVQPETLAAVTIGGTPVTNNPPAGATNHPIRAIVSRGRRSAGLIPRQVRLRLSTGTVPAGYDARSVTVIPALTEVFYNTCQVGSQVTYLGAAWVVVGRSPEIAR